MDYVVPSRIYGRDLQVNDVIGTWFTPGKCVITSLGYYKTVLDYLWFPELPRVATFATPNIRMAIEPKTIYRLYSDLKGRNEIKQETFKAKQ